MKRIKKLLKKVNKIVENLDIQEVIEEIQLDEENNYEIQLNEFKIYYKDNDEYKVTLKNRYKNYEEYNNYEVEGDVWTSIRAS